MALIEIKGMFIAANLHQTKFDGKEKTSVVIDLYQPTSPLKDKAVQVKADDLTVLSEFNQNFATGDIVTIRATVNAYKNDAFYKFIDVQPAS